jgi:predicted DNA-binding protein
VLQYWQMSNTLTVRLPDDLLKRLREKSRRAGLPVGQVVRQFIENGLSQEAPAEQKQVWRKYVGIIKGGPKDVSSRKGFSRG